MSDNSGFQPTAELIALGTEVAAAQPATTPVKQKARWRLPKFPRYGIASAAAVMLVLAAAWLWFPREHSSVGPRADIDPVIPDVVEWYLHPGNDDTPQAAVRGSQQNPNAAFTEARDSLEALYKAGNNSPEVVDPLACAYLMESKTDKARRGLNTCLEQHPDSARLKILRAVVAYQYNELEEAKRLLNEITDDYPGTRSAVQAEELLRLWM